MKKLLLFLLAMGVAAAPANALTNVYQTGADGQFVIETTDCRTVNRLMSLSVPDEPPTGQTPDDPPTGQTPDDPPTGQTPDDPPTGEVVDDEGEVPLPPQPEPKRPKVVDPNVREGAQKVVDAVAGEEKFAFKRTLTFQDISIEDERLTSVANFEDRQESFATYVREVNWKTHLHITWRDQSFFRRLKMACSGLTQMTKPMRFNLDAYVGDLDKSIEKATNKGVDKLAQAARGNSFNAMSRLSLIGLADAIEKVNPFLLMAVDEDTYRKLLEMNPKIADLFEDMYTFFKIRAVRMPAEYDTNTSDLIRVSEIGKGDAFETWHVLSEFAKKMLSLERDGKLNPNDEKEIHIWKLESAMRFVKEHVRVERRAAELAAKDPNNEKIMKKIKSGMRKKPSLDDKAIELLRNSSPEEVERLIRKYIAK